MNAKSSVPEDDRRERILDAALREFAEQGYDQGSTNAIAKAAGVAKGLIFHHFGNKQALYVAVVERAVARVTAQYERERAESSNDIFERLLGGMVHENELMRAYPLEYRLIGEAFYSRVSPLPEPVRQKYEAFGRGELERMLLDGVDASRLRPGVSLEQVAELIHLIVDAMTRRVQLEAPGSPSWDDQVTEFYRQLGDYLDIIRNGAYRREEPGKGAP